MSVEINNERVRPLYEIIVNKKLGDDPESFQQRIGIIKELGKILKADFKSTEDFYFKVKNFLSKGKSRPFSLELKRARKKIKWTQKELAFKLSCSQQFVAAMEKGEKSPIEKALKFVELCGFPVFDKLLIIEQLSETDEK